MRDPSSLIRDQTCAPALEAQSLNHWTAREVHAQYIILNCQKHLTLLFPPTLHDKYWRICLLKCFPIMRKISYAIWSLLYCKFNLFYTCFFFCDKILFFQHIQTFPDLQCFVLWFFIFTMVWKQCVLHRNHTLNFDYWSFPGLAICTTIHSFDAFINVKVSHSSQPAMWSQGKQLIYLQSFYFSLSVQYSISYMRYLTLYYKIGFVLDNFAQL